MKTIKTFNSGSAEFSLGGGRGRHALPKRAQVLAVWADKLGIMSVTVAVNPNEEDSEERVFWVIQSGQRIPTGAGRVTHIGSATLRDFNLWHVFEIDSPEDGPRKAAGLRGAAVVNQQSGPILGNLAQVGMVTGAIRRSEGGVHIQ